MSSPSGAMWPIITFVGPVLLAAVLLWALLRNRMAKRSGTTARSEDATRNLYDKEEAARRAEDDDGA